MARALSEALSGCEELTPNVASGPRSAFVEVRESHHGIVGKYNKSISPFETWSHLDLKPFIQHMMQEDVRETGRDHAPLRGAFGRIAQETIFQDPCFQPLSIICR